MADLDGRPLLVNPANVLATLCRSGLLQSERLTEGLDADGIELHPPPAVLERIKKCLADTGDSNSRFDELKSFPGMDMYVFRVSGARVCPYGVTHSGSNNFCVLVRGRNLLYKCNNAECCDVHSQRKIGELTAQESMMGEETAPFADDDTTVYKMLTKPFVDYWAFKGDMGGSRIIAQMYSRCHRLWHDGKSWWIWDGKRYKQTTTERVKFTCIHQLSTVYARLRNELKEELSQTTDEEQKKELEKKLDKGFGHLTPTIDSFLADIFNSDQPLIDFMQKLWGYAMNGRTSEEIIVFLLGSGGNGKGVCKQMLETTLGEYYGVMSKDAVVKAPGQRPPSKGAATGYLAELQGVRVALTDETSPGERVDLGLVLMMTGGGAVKSRLLFQNNGEFRFTHTPFIQTNYDPEIPPTLAKQPNIDRRLIVVRFPNEYVSENKFDETNPCHRHADVGLKDRMETPAVREEFLTYLVHGSRAWYEDPTVLRRHPPAVQAAAMAWLRRGDKLQTFLQSEHCEHDPADTPANAKSVTWKDDFWRHFQEFAGVKIAKEELARQMREKGFGRTKRAGRFTGVPHERSSCYVGFKCEYD